MSTKRRAWAVMAAALLGGVAVAVNQFKVPPVMQALMAELQVDMTTGGWLMSVFALAPIVLAIPAALLLARLGPKRAGLIALGCAVVGSVVGAVAPSAAVLLVGRLVEGLSLTLMAVVAPAAISLWFEPQERGLPMGIWAAWVPLGNVIAFNTGPALLGAFGWRSVWWFGTAVALLAAAVFALVVDSPPGREVAQTRTAGWLASQGRALLSMPLWLLALVFGVLSLCVIGYNTWAPAYLSESLGLALAPASLYASLLFLAGIPGNITAGWALNRMSHRYRLLSGALVVTCVLFAWSFRLDSVGVVVPYMVLLGFVSNLAPTSIFTLAPETVGRAEYAGLSMAVILMGSSVGVLAGPPLVAAVVGNVSWSAGSWLLVAAMAVGVAAALLAGRLAQRVGQTARNASGR